MVSILSLIIIKNTSKLLMNELREKMGLDAEVGEGEKEKEAETT